MSDNKNAYFIQAVRFIYKNIDKPINLEKIAVAVGVSLSSLKRIFQEAVDQSPGEFIRRLRMEFAFRSLQSKDDSILEIALASGFDDHSAFSRRFKEMFGYSPSQAREKINIVSELECITLEEPDMIELADLEIQCATETGLYFESAPQAWKTLREKLNSFEISDDFLGYFIGIGHDNPHDGKVAEDQVRYSAGVSLIERNIGLNFMTIRGGRYARFHYVGKPANLGLAYHYIFGKWAESSTNKINFTSFAFQVFDAIPDPLKEPKILIHVPVL